MLLFKLFLPILAQAAPAPALEEEIVELLEDQVAVLDEDLLEIFEIDFEDSDDEDFESFCLDD